MCAGHEKYLKTTVFGLTGMQPDIVVVVVGANMGVKRMTKEHLAIAVAVRCSCTPLPGRFPVSDCAVGLLFLMVARLQLEIPIVVALTKIDIAPKNVAKETLATIRQSLRKCKMELSLVACMFRIFYCALIVSTQLLLPCRWQDGDAR